MSTMNAILKEEPTQELSTILVIADQLPVDFYSNPVYDKNLDTAIEATANLVYNLDDSGEKLAKSDATSINKFATLYDKFIAATYKGQTEEVGRWRDSKKAKTKLLLANRQRLIDQFAEKRLEKIAEITETLTKELLLRRIEKGVKEEFFSTADLSPVIKLTGTMTDGGALTKKAKDFISAIAANDLAEQNRIEGRYLILENRCLRADINPPLTKAHFGTVFYASDEFFNEKLEELIATEVERRAEMEARIIKQQEAQKQRELDAALKAQQAEADRIAKAAAQKEFAEKQAALRAEQAKKDAEKSGSYGGSSYSSGLYPAPEKVEPVPLPIKKQEEATPSVARPGKRTVRFTAEFEVVVSDRVSNKGVEDHFLTQISDKLKLALKKVEFVK